MYGVALGCIALMDHKQDINLLNEKIVLTPILLSACWILSGNNYYFQFSNSLNHICSIWLMIFFCTIRKYFVQTFLK